jgi:hypothetical protein
MLTKLIKDCFIHIWNNCVTTSKSRFARCICESRSYNSPCYKHRIHSHASDTTATHVVVRVYSLSWTIPAISANNLAWLRSSAEPLNNLRTKQVPILLNGLRPMYTIIYLRATGKPNCELFMAVNEVQILSEIISERVKTVVFSERTLNNRYFRKGRGYASQSYAKEQKIINIRLTLWQCDTVDTDIAWLALNYCSRKSTCLGDLALSKTSN